jgi:hypothetical protein
VEEKTSRLAPARRRARIAKIGIAASAIVAFAVTLPLARATHRGHVKSPARALDAPLSFRHAVQSDLLAAGILAPAQAPADAVTALS